MGARACTEEPVKLTPAIHSYPPTCPTGLPASPTYLPTHLSYQPYLPTYLLVYLPTYLLVYLPALPTYLPTCLPSSLTYLPTYLLVYLPALQTYLHAYLPTCLPTNPAHPFPLPTNYLLTRLLLVAKSLSTRDPTYCRPHRTLAVSPVEHSGQSVSVCKARSRPAGRAFSVFKNFPRTLFPGLTCTGREIELGHFCLALLPPLFRFPRGHGCMIQSGVIGVGPRAHPCARPLTSRSDRTSVHGTWRGASACRAQAWRGSSAPGRLRARHTRTRAAPRAA